MERVHRRTCPTLSCLFLLPEQLPGVVSHSGKEEHQVTFEFPKMIVAQNNWFYERAPIGIERDEIQPSERGGILVLFADRFAEDIACNMECSFCQVVFGERTI